MLGAGAPPVFPPPGTDSDVAFTALAIGLIVIMAALAFWATKRLSTRARSQERAADLEYEQAA